MGESEAYLLGRESEILAGKEILAQPVKQGSHLEEAEENGSQSTGGRLKRSHQN